MVASVVGAARTPSNGTDATGASLALTIPAGTAIDDYALVIVELWDSSATNPTLGYPAGFTQIVNYVSTTDGFQKMKVAIKKLTAADSGTYSVTGFGSHFRQGHVVICRGIDATTALDVAIQLAQNATGTALPSPHAITTVTAGCLILRITCNENTCTGLPDTGYTEQLDSNYLKTNTKIAGAAGTDTPAGGSFSASTLKLSALIALRPAGGGASLTLGLISETDSAFALTKTKEAAVGLVSESDSALALSRQKVGSLGQPSESDSTAGMSRAKSSSLGLPAESDTAFSLTFSKAGALGLAASTDSALPLSPNKLGALGLTAESDTAHPLVPAKAGVFGLPSEGDTVPALTFAKAVGLGQVVEGDSVFALGRGKSLTLGVPTETDTVFALNLVGGVTLVLGLVAEDESALTLGTPTKVKTFGLISETDTPLVLGRAKSVVLGQTSESDSVLALAFAKAVILGLAEEEDIALALDLDTGGVEPPGPVLKIMHNGMEVDIQLSDMKVYRYGGLVDVVDVEVVDHA